MIYNERACDNIIRMIGHAHSLFNNKNYTANIRNANRIVYSVYYKQGAYSPIEYELLFNDKFLELKEAKYALYKQLQIRHIPFKYRYNIMKNICLNKSIEICNSYISASFVIVEEELDGYIDASFKLDNKIIIDEIESV